MLKSQRLSLKIYKLFQHGVGSCDDTGVCLEASLSDDHIGEFLSKVYVGHFQLAGFGSTCTGVAGLSDTNGSRSSGNHKVGISRLEKSLGVIENGNFDSCQRLDVALIGSGQNAVGADGEGFQVLEGSSSSPKAS